MNKMYDDAIASRGAPPWYEILFGGAVVMLLAYWWIDLLTHIHW